MTKNRLQLPDILKGIAVLLMIQVHLTELFANQSFYDSLPGKISLVLGGIPAAPLFMVVMGFFAGLYTLKPKSFIYRGMKLIVLGFLLNIGLNLHLFIRIYTGALSVNPFPYIFGVDILFLAGLSLMIIGLIRKISDNYVLPLISIVIVLVLSSILPYYHGYNTALRYVMAYFYSNDWWSYFPLLPWLGYPLAGMTIGIIYRRYPDRFFKLCTNPLAFILPLIIIIVFAEYGYKISSNLDLYYHHSAAFFLWALMVLTVISSGLYYTQRFFSWSNLIFKFLTWIGMNVTAFYIIQWLLIGNIATALYKTQSQESLILWYFFITAVTTTLVWLWQKSKFSKLT